MTRCCRGSRATQRPVQGDRVSNTADKAPQAHAAREVRRLRAENRKLHGARQALLAVQEASAAVASRLDPAEALQEVVDRALEVVGGSSAAIFIAGADRRHLEPRAVAGDAALTSAPRLNMRSPNWPVLCQAGGVIAGDAQSHPVLASVQPQMRGLGIKSLLAVPLVARGGVIGLLLVTHKRRKNAFRRNDKEVLRLFADQAAAALENSRLYAEAVDRSARQRDQLELGKKLLDVIRDPAVLLDADDRIAFANQALSSVLGCRPNEVLGRKWHELVDPEDVEAIRAQREQIGDGPVVSGEFNLVRADGSRVPVLLRSGRSHDAAGRLLGTAAVLVDFADRQRMEGTIHKRDHMLEAIGGMAKAVGRASDQERLAGAALDRALRLLGLQTGALYLTEGDQMVLIAARGISAEHRAHVRRVPIKTATISARALQSRKPVIFADIRLSCRLDSGVRRFVPPTTHAHITVPIPGRDAPIGVLMIGSPDRSPFTREAVSALKVLAAQFGAAAENMRLYQTAREQADRLTTLNEVATQLMSVSDPYELMRIACDGVARVMRAQRVICFDYQVREGVLIPAGGHGVNMRKLRGLRKIKLRDAPLIALAVSERQPVLCSDVTAQKSVPADYAEKLGLRAAVVVPVLSRKWLCGVLVVDNPGAGISLGPDLRDMVMAMANQGAVSHDNMHLLQEERRRSEQLSLTVREAHHRIKNNLQAVCDVLELELIDCGRGDAAPTQAIEHSVQRVRAIAMVHEFLSRHHDVAMVDVAKVLERLVPLAVTGNQRRDQQVEAVVKAPSLMQSAKRTTAIALIVNELISNAVQHGLNHGRRGAVKVEMRDRNGTVSLTVSDNGSGLPEGFDPCVHAHVGLEIARVLAERDLGGSITIERPRNRKSGTVARISFRK